MKLFGAEMQLEYSILNVFTTEETGGNPLAVVMNADGLSDERMQKIAAQFNLSETVFVCRPSSPTNTAALRIFTPRSELPFAGHPTIGTAVVLGEQKRLTAVRLEEKIGRITCLLERKSKSVGSARFVLPKVPEEVGPAPNRETVAATLGINAEDIGFGAFPDVKLYSAGLPYYLVPVKNAEVLANINLERRGWASTYPEGIGAIYVFTATPEERRIDFAARMFSPDMPFGEDPATGSAAGALIGLLATDPSHVDGQRDYKLRQGLEMGRPSVIDLQVGVSQGDLVLTAIGGAAVVVATGTMDLAD